MKLAMIGTGYVGLVSGVCFSDFGHQVVCVDKQAQKIAMLKEGGVPIYEPGLDGLLARNVAAGRLSFTTDPAEALKGVDAVFIGVGTPTRRGVVLDRCLIIISSIQNFFVANLCGLRESASGVNHR